MVVNHHPNARFWRLTICFSAQTSGWFMIMCGLCTCAWFPPPPNSGLQWQPATQSQSLPPLPAECGDIWQLEVLMLRRYYLYSDIPNSLSCQFSWYPKIGEVTPGLPLNKVHLWQCFGPCRRLSSKTPNGNVRFTIVGIHFGVPGVPFSWSLPWLGDGYVCIIG
jgi:hypothetical protein